MGETSGTAVRALSLGKPLVVSDVGWFSELPDEVAIKVPVDEHEVGRPRRRARATCRGPARARRRWAPRLARSRSAEHALPAWPSSYAAALEQAAGGEAVRDATSCARWPTAAADVGIGAGDPAAAELAARLDEVGLGG